MRLALYDESEQHRKPYTVTGLANSTQRQKSFAKHLYIYLVFALAIRATTIPPLNRMDIIMKIYSGISH